MVRLPPPLLVVGIRPPVPPTADLSTEIRAARVVEWVGLIVDPLSGGQVAVSRQCWASLNEINPVLFLVSPERKSRVDIEPENAEEETKSFDGHFV